MSRWALQVTNLKKPTGLQRCCNLFSPSSFPRESAPSQPDRMVTGNHQPAIIDAGQCTKPMNISHGLGVSRVQDASLRLLRGNRDFKNIAVRKLRPPHFGICSEYAQGHGRCGGATVFPSWALSVTLAKGWSWKPKGLVLRETLPCGGGPGVYRYIYSEDHRLVLYLNVEVMLQVWKSCECASNTWLWKGMQGMQGMRDSESNAMMLEKECKQCVIVKVQ